MTIEQAKMICNGNQQAEAFISAFVGYCHLIDDIVDEGGVKDTRMAKETLQLFEQFFLNPWFKEYGPLLWPLVVQGTNAWLDANVLAKSEKQENKIASDVIKGMYHEVVWFTAYLCGGFDHMKQITSTMREYDFESRKEEN